MATTGPEREDLGRAECLRLIGQRGSGRITFDDTLLPVGYAVRPHTVTLRSLHTDHAVHSDNTDHGDLADRTSFASGAAVVLQVHQHRPAPAARLERPHPGPARPLHADGLPGLRLELVPHQVTGHLVYEPSLF
ncbi:hypothetical protein [Nonomuraea helvata]|uniref:Uncharacterized protein n=1 Tax=Nonomuraea helvata TaxID=37484 RepID=A0ABV5RY24_9ACTN